MFGESLSKWFDKSPKQERTAYKVYIKDKVKSYHVVFQLQHVENKRIMIIGGKLEAK